MTRRPDSINSPDKSPNSLIRSLVLCAVAITTALSSTIIGANNDTGSIDIIGYVLTFSGIVGFVVIKYRRYKHGFYYNAIALVITATGAGILFVAFFDWLY